MHYLGIKRWIIVESIVRHRGMVMDHLNLLIQLPKFLLNFRFLDDKGLRLLGRSLAWHLTILQPRALGSSPPWLWAPRVTLVGRPPFWIFRRGLRLLHGRRLHHREWCWDGLNSLNSRYQVLNLLKVELLHTNYHWLLR